MLSRNIERVATLTAKAVGVAPVTSRIPMTTNEQDITMNEPINLIDIDPDLAARAMVALYRYGWPTADLGNLAPTDIVGALIDDLGYIVIVANGKLIAVYRYTNNEQLKRLKRWPADIDALVADLNLVDAAVTAAVEQRLGARLGRGVA